MKLAEIEKEIEEIWFEEAERREKAWDAGEVEGIPAELVRRELRRTPRRETPAS